IGVPLGAGIARVDSGAPWCGPSNFLTSASLPEYLNEFSELLRTKREGEVLPSLQMLEPRLQKLSLLFVANQPMIHGDLKGLGGLLPLSMMGEGMRRLLGILASIASAAGGRVLIDEVENGFHY